MQHVDPPDLKLWPTLRHLYPLWRAQWRLVAIGLTCALVFTGLSLAIPILDPADDRQRDRRRRHVTALALPRADHACWRRFASASTSRAATPTARVGIAVEARLRGMMYDAYLRFPRAFYDRHATGEVISRATNDIYPVRYFIGWGVVQAIQSVMMLIGASIVLLSVNPRLTLFAALAMPPVAILTYVFAHKVFPISRVVQAQERPPDRGHGRGGRRASRWCRPSAARTTCASASRAAPRRSAPRRCDRRASRRASCRA